MLQLPLLCRIDYRDFTAETCAEIDFAPCVNIVFQGSHEAPRWYHITKMTIKSLQVKVYKKTCPHIVRQGCCTRTQRQSEGGINIKILVTGATGQLGYDVMRELIGRGHEAIGTGRGASAAPWRCVPLDITEEQAVRRVMEEIKPDAVIHCAAWTAVDAAEDAENIPLVWAINADGTAYLARAAKELDCKMIYISTDYVFSGQGTAPWLPDCRDFQPLNVYGQTKLEGELAVTAALDKYFIVRIAWVFGLNGKNFVKTMLQLGKTHDILRVVSDQIGTPTYTFDLARFLADMVETERYGYYHATNEGCYLSWCDFACEIFRQAGYATKVIPVTTAEYGFSRAARPFNSRLDKEKLKEKGFTPLPLWNDALGRYLQTIKTQRLL